jgi:hypothetical protein
MEAEVIFVSVFRDSQGYLDRYWEQTEMLRHALGERPLYRVMVEGDSADQTYKALEENLQAGDTLLKCEHGGPPFPSKNIPMRWRQIALACNVAMTAATRDNHERLPIIYCESDLIWGAPTMLKLLEHLETFPAVAPMSMQGARFYDLYAYTKDDRHFSPWPPYHSGIAANRMDRIDTAGSCIAMEADVADVVEFSLQDCIKGVGRSIYAHGYSLWLDPTLSVRHP